MEKTFQLPWQVPFGACALKLDPLSQVFLLAIGVVVLCAGIYGVGYLRAYRAKPLGLHSFFYVMLAIALLVIVMADNIILFLGAWEAMTIATYFLIVFHDERVLARKAGFLYLIASHCGTFLLFLMFFLMAHTAGSMNFDRIAQTAFSPVLAGILFGLALLGFGVKAGFIPMHIWLPHAHPEAPSHISALLSGVAIKMGIYGICRVLWIVGVLPDGCGYVLMAIGMVSGVMGVLYALGQHELKKLLAYHSIENIGIIALGLGVGLLGRSHHMPFLAVLGFGGALLHVVNHSLFKGLLFLSAGAVIQRTHTGEMDRMGGLAKVMPVTSAFFFIGAWSICGLPLFNGFISEFIIFLALFQGLFVLPLHGAVFCATGILALALMGALALACFTKVYGTVFTGDPREVLETQKAAGEKEISAWMLAPMAVLAGICLWIGLAPQTMAQLAFSAGSYVLRGAFSIVELEQVLWPLRMIVGTAFLFLALILVLVLVRRLLLGPLPMPVREGWRCGFSLVSSKFQYTSSSFARSIVEFVKKALLMRRHGGRIQGYFPERARMSSSVHDASEDLIFRPVLVRLTAFSRKMDDSRIRYTQMYLMYIFLFLIFLLVWKLK